MSDAPETLMLGFLRRLDAKIDNLAEADAHLSARVDRLSDRIERVERWLDIVPA